MPQPTSAASFSRREKARLRLASQGLTVQRWQSAEEVARAFGVMQGQDLHSVRRSLALRAQDHSDAENIVRGYPMRHTLFAASIKDIGWITELCAKEHKGDAELRAEVTNLIDRPLSRAELKERAATTLPEVPFWHVVRVAMESGHAVYSGVEQLITPVELPGLDEAFNGDQVAATADLMVRYFRTHGPATLLVGDHVQGEQGHVRTDRRDDVGVVDRHAGGVDGAVPARPTAAMPSWATP